MIRYCVNFVFCCGLLISCNNKTEEKKNTDSNDEESDSPVLCYSYQNSKDTILLKVIPLGESVTGTLVYVLDGKDKNTGTIQGVVRGDLLVADYTFMSEGIRSVRQVAFRKNDNFYVEGYGDIVTGGDRVTFQNTDSLWFNDSIRLMETECRH